MSADPSVITQMPLSFQLALAPTVTRSSNNRTFTVKSLADLIAAQPAVQKEIADALIEKHGVC